MESAKDYFFKKVTLLNVLLTFSIVLLHAETPIRWGLPLDATHGFIYWTHQLTQIGVPTFFFLSGLLFYRGCKFSDIECKLRSRVHSLLIPYLLWNVIFVVIYSALAHLPVVAQRMNAVHVWHSMKEVVFAVINARCTDLWFVKDLMLFCAFSAFLFICVERLRSALLLLFISTAFALSADLGYEHPMLWLPSYLSGAVVGRYFVYDRNGGYMRFMGRHGRAARLLAGTILTATLLLLCFLSGRDGGGYAFLYRFAAPLMIWAVMDLLLYSYIAKRFVVRSWMGYMFFIYCVHHFVLNILQKFVVLSLPPTDVVLNLTYVLSPIVAVITLLAVARVLSRYRFFSILTGGR